MPVESLPETLTRYVTERDNYVARYRLRASGIIGAQGSAGGPLGFNTLVTGHAVELASTVPPLTLAQWEGFSELVSSYLAHLRMNGVKS